MCDLTRGMDEKIDLIPEAKFYEEAPTKISKPVRLNLIFL